jgi:hypothetical protein
MNRHFHGSALGIAIVLMLPACAATPPASQTAKSSAAASADKAVNGYRLVRKNGEDYYCKREAVTGSRTRSVDTCLTTAQMEAMRRDSQELLRSLERGPGDMPTIDQGGGRSGGFMK